MDKYKAAKTRLILHKPVKDAEPGDIVIYITDIQAHVLQPQNPKTIDREISRSVRSGKPGRSYTTKFKPTSPGRIKINFPMNDELKELVDKAEKEGKRVFLAYPDGGVPIIPGKDLIEKLQADKRKGKLPKDLEDLTEIIDAYSVNATLTI